MESISHYLYGEGDNAIKRLEEEISRRFGYSVSGSLGVNGLIETPVPPLGWCFTSAPLIDSKEFVGHVAELDRIHCLLETGNMRKEQKKVVLGGTGGVGKTQVAIAYARQHQQIYTSIIWLNATTEKTLNTSLLSVARAIGLDNLGTSSDRQIREGVIKWLCMINNSRWLLIFDGYDESDLLGINNFCSEVRHGSIIVTTRLPNLVSGQRVWLEPIQELDDGLRILEIRSGRSNVKQGK